jgi:hypothetical protein
MDDPCVKPETNSVVYLLSKTLTHPGYLNIFLMRQAKIIKRQPDGTLDDQKEITNPISAV